MINKKKQYTNHFGQQTESSSLVVISFLVQNSREINKNKNKRFSIYFLSGKNKSFLSLSRLFSGKNIRRRRKKDMDDSYSYHHHHLSPVSLLHRIKDSFHFAISSLLANLFSALFTFFFALGSSIINLSDRFYKIDKEFCRRNECVIGFLFIGGSVGTLLGALTGALIGQETESGFIRGAAVGAISGAVFSIEVFESSLLLWQSDESGIGCLLYLVIHSLSIEPSSLSSFL